MHDSSVDDAVELLQALGLKEYEAKCFVALSRVEDATAKAVSELSEVPRTRVYDAVDALEDAGLVARQHANPQRFRAVPVAEAAETLRDEYDARIDDLRDALDDLPDVQRDADTDTTDVWSLTGASAVANRTTGLVADAEATVVLVATADALDDAGLADELAAAVDTGVAVTVGGVDQPARNAAAAALGDDAVFAADPAWLAGPVDDDADVDRLLLVDGTRVLYGTGGDDPHAVVATGAENVLVAVARRLLADAPAEVPVTPR